LQEVLTYPGRLPGEYGPGLVGSTATTAVVDLGRAQLVIANVGDSRGVLCKGGRAVRLTAEHTVAEESERDRIERNGGEVEADRVSAGCISNELAMETLKGVKRCSCYDWSLAFRGRALFWRLTFRRTVVAESRKVGGTLKL
jgi:serine/threonine protein phosphatase PrpC